MILCENKYYKSKFHSEKWLQLKNTNALVLQVLFSWMHAANIHTLLSD